jgi:excinuclease ABC subunit C
MTPKTFTAGDDYAMMREVIQRRFARLQQEDPDKTKEAWPDLVLIDGGPGQLSSVASVFEELGISDVPFVAISKGEGRNAGREWFYRVGREPFQLDFNDPVLHYLQRLRDEVHRYAIGSHRTKRSKAIRSNPLDDVKGIGGNRKRALLQHFGSAKGVEAASLAELEKVTGISKQIALKIYHHFHSA